MTDVFAVSTDPPERARRAATMITGVAVALGMSTTGIVLGALAARGLDASTAIPGHVSQPAFLALSVIGVVCSGGMVAHVASSHARTASVVAGTIVFLATFEIMRSVESTGVEGAEWPLLLGISIGYFLLLLVGIAMHRRYGPPANATRL